MKNWSFEDEDLGFEDENEDELSLGTNLPFSMEGHMPFDSVLNKK